MTDHFVDLSAEATAISSSYSLSASYASDLIFPGGAELTPNASTFVTRIAGVLVRTDTLAASGNVDMRFANTVGSVTMSQAQDTGGQGAAWLIQAQKSTAGYAGNDLTIGGGQGGDVLNNRAGNVNIDLGRFLTGSSAKLRLVSDQNDEFGRLYASSGPYFYVENSTAASVGLVINASTGLLALQQGGGAGAQVWLPADGTIQVYKAGSLIHTDTMDATGANTVNYVTGTTSVAFQHGGLGRVSFNGVGLGFYGTAPVGQALRVTQLTGSNGGSTTSNAGALVDVGAAPDQTKINDNIAKIQAKINAIELALHNIGITL